MLCDANSPPAITAPSSQDYAHIHDWVPDNSSNIPTYQHQQKDQQRYGLHDAQLQDNFPVEQSQGPTNTILDSDLPQCDHIGQLHTQIAEVYHPGK